MMTIEKFKQQMYKIFNIDPISGIGDAIELHWLGKKYFVNRYVNGVIHHPSLDPTWQRLGGLVAMFCWENGIAFVEMERAAVAQGIVKRCFMDSQVIFFDVTSHKLSFYMFCEEELLEFLEKLREECGKKEVEE